MAMAWSLGKRSLKTKACNIVDTSITATMSVETRLSITHSVFVTVFVTSFAYLTVADGESSEKIDPDCQRQIKEEANEIGNP